MGASRIMNRRPLLPVAVAFALGVVLGRYIHLQIAYIIAAVVLTAAAVYFRKRKALWLVCAASAMLAAFLTAGIMTVQYAATGEGLTVSGRITREPYVNEYQSTVVMLDSAAIDGKACGGVKLYISGETNLKPGNVIKASAEVEVPKGVRNPGGFDEKLYLLSQGVNYKAYADTAETMGWQGGFVVWCAEARQYLGSVVDRVFEEDIAPFAKAMLLGDTEGIDEQTYTAFRDTGMAHVLAVSGLNAAILTAFVYYVLRLLRIGRTPRLAVTVLFIAAYACVTGLTPSIVRAAIMSCAVLLGKHSGRQTDTLNFLALSFIIALVMRPLDLFTASFQLSFSAVFGMITLGNQIRRRLTPKLPARLSFIGDSFSASVGATAGTAPVLATTFNRVPTLSILINIVVIPLASAATVVVFIAVLFGILFGQLAVYVAYIASAMTRLMLMIIRAAANIPFIALDVASPPWYAALACFLLLFVSSGYLLIRAKFKTVISMVMCATIGFVLAFQAYSGMYMVFLDVGEGDAAFIHTAQGGEYFIDGGRERSVEEVVSFTRRRGITPEAAFITHTDDDHFAGLVALYNAGLLNKVFCSYQEEAVVRAAMPDAEVVPLAAGDTVLLDERTSAMVLYPYKDSTQDETNELSLALRIEYNGHTALFTGDLSGAEETKVLASVGKVDIYKAAHHGSKYSSYRLPLSVLSPEYSVVSVGSNAFGHPEALAMKNLKDYSGQVFTTMDDYAVEFYIDDDIQANTYGGQDQDG